ncbi:RHS repeat-associated core domain-containing protein [Pseudomonas sp. BF-RE-26]|uniref:RHS repeat-associated core domain-containing protein n=1 Tax=Pseudomonas sp. BF-RE-26 TaxID=2832396 RepID=UPI001CBE92C0|nr:RHS repeat-associated core domain-containing protein [Pseudomonas sp. BF-RE-26]
MMPGEQEHQRFYCKNRLSTEIQGKISYSIVQHGDQLLAQQQTDGDVHHTTLPANDQQRSILQTTKTNHHPQSIAYSPYGHSPSTSGLLSLLGFNGERPDPLTGHYLLGNGYRAFNPVLMRFNSPDSFSPFGRGGLNSYAYVLGDPINSRDPTGHKPLLMQSIVDALIKHKPRLKIPRPHILPSTHMSINTANSTPDGYTLAGFHGSSSKHIASFEKGLDIKHAGSANGQKHGEGFYTTLDIDFAGNYAKTSIEREYKGIKQPLFPYEDFSYDPAIANTSYIAGKPPTIFEVHVKNYQTKIPGKDFTYIPGERNTATGSEIVFPLPMYESIKLKPLASLANLPTPWTANLNIRKS